MANKRRNKRRHSARQDDRPQNRHQRDRQQQAGKGQQHIHDAHEDVIEPAADIAGQRADQRPNHNAEGHGREADEEGNLRRVHDPAKQIAAVAVQSEKILRLIGRTAQQVNTGRRADLIVGVRIVDRIVAARG